MASRDDGHDLCVVAPGRGDLQALVRRVLAERADDLVAHRAQRALRDVLADEIDGGDQRLGLDGQQARRTGERVAVGLGVDLDHPVVADLGVEHVGPGAEVDHVEQRDVLAQLGVGEPERLAQLGRAQAPPGSAGLDEDAGQRDQSGEALGPDRRVGRGGRCWTRARARR